MLQAADVGVGIMGKEGRQAVNNSDYAIPQFRSCILPSAWPKRTFLSLLSLLVMLFGRELFGPEAWHKIPFERFMSSVQVPDAAAIGARVAVSVPPVAPDQVLLLQEHRLRLPALLLPVLLRLQRAVHGGMTSARPPLTWFFTSLPILLFAVLDRPVHNLNTLLRFPQVSRLLPYLPINLCSCALMCFQAGAGLRKLWS